MNEESVMVKVAKFFMDFCVDVILRKNVLLVVLA
jgi:hypothetical protein